MEAAFFDLDKTVIAKASVVAFGTPFYKEGLISRRTILRGLWGQLVYLHLGADEEKIVRMRTSVLALTKGWDQARVRAIVEDALEAVVEPIIYAEALDLITAHRGAGRLVVIVSASPAEIVQPLAGYLGADEAVASRAAVDEDGRYTGKMEFDAFGPAKARAMEELAARRGIDLGASYAYSDSFTDLAMLEAVGHPVAVNADRDLARVAHERGWEARTFTRPVRLRPRARRAAPIAAAGAGLAMAGGGAAWWWYTRLRSPQGDGAGTALAGGGQVLRWVGQSTRSLRAATTPRATRMARRRSFFMLAG